MNIEHLLSLVLLFSNQSCVCRHQCSEAAAALMRGNFLETTRKVVLGHFDALQFVFDLGLVK